MLVAAVLAPEDAEHAEFDLVGLTSHAGDDFVVFVAGEGEFGEGGVGGGHGLSLAVWQDVGRE